jgi:hypothetical protein
MVLVLAGELAFLSGRESGFLSLWGALVLRIIGHLTADAPNRDLIPMTPPWMRPHNADFQPRAIR